MDSKKCQPLGFIQRGFAEEHGGGRGLLQAPQTRRGVDRLALAPPAHRTPLCFVWECRALHIPASPEEGSVVHSLSSTAKKLLLVPEGLALPCSLLMPGVDSVTVLWIPQKWRLREGAAVGSKKGGSEDRPLYGETPYGGRSASGSSE